jgi:hypothetical protein
MCYGWFEIVLADQDLSDELAKRPAAADDSK